MADEEKTDVEQEETEVKDQANTEVKDQTETEQADNEAEEPKTVPFERFQEMTDKVKLLEEQVVNAQQQMAIARANQSQKEPAAKFDIFKEVGLTDDDDVPTVKQYKQIIEHHATVFDRKLADLAFHQAHPDFAEYVGTVDEIASGNYAAPLAAAIKNNPAIARMIGESPNPRMAAYNIAKLQKTKSTPVKIKEAKDIIDDAKNNSERVKSSSNTKGGEALSEEGRYATMNDADFLKIAHKHGAFV
jgi:hypothetical protein